VSKAKLPGKKDTTKLNDKVQYDLVFHHGSCSLTFQGKNIKHGFLGGKSERNTTQETYQQSVLILKLISNLC
jgi:hypothetical protein